MSENDTRSNKMQPFIKALLEGMTLGMFFNISISVLTDDSWANDLNKYPVFFQKLCNQTFMGNLFLVTSIVITSLFLLISIMNFILSRATEGSLATLYGIQIVFISALIIPSILFLCNLKWITEQFIEFYSAGWMVLYVFSIMYSQKTMVRNTDI